VAPPVAPPVVPPMAVVPPRVPPVAPPLLPPVPMLPPVARVPPGAAVPPGALDPPVVREPPVVAPPPAALVPPALVEPPEACTLPPAGTVPAVVAAAGLPPVATVPPALVTPPPPAPAPPSALPSLLCPVPEVPLPEHEPRARASERPATTATRIERSAMEIMSKSPVSWEEEEAGFHTDDSRISPRLAFKKAALALLTGSTTAIQNIVGSCVRNSNRRKIHSRSPALLRLSTTELRGEGCAVPGAYRPGRRCEAVDRGHSGWRALQAHRRVHVRVTREPWASVADASADAVAGAEAGEATTFGPSTVAEACAQYHPSSSAAAVPSESDCSVVANQYETLEYSPNQWSSCYMDGTPNESCTMTKVTQSDGVCGDPDGCRLTASSTAFIGGAFGFWSFAENYGDWDGIGIWAKLDQGATTHFRLTMLDGSSEPIIDPATGYPNCYYDSSSDGQNWDHDGIDNLSPPPESLRCKGAANGRPSTVRRLCDSREWFAQVPLGGRDRPTQCKCDMLRGARVRNCGDKLGASHLGESRRKSSRLCLG
jgi:hypothetical protein